MADLNLVQDDTYPTRFRLTDAAGPVDLTTASNIELYLKKSGTLVTVTCNPDPDQTANRGWATAPWGGADLSVAGDYETEVQVTWADATKATFPEAAVQSVSIREDLGD